MASDRSCKLDFVPIDFFVGITFFYKIFLQKGVFWKLERHCKSVFDIADILTVSAFQLFLISQLSQLLNYFRYLFAPSY